MTTRTPARKTQRATRSARTARVAAVPTRPDVRLWEVDRAKAFEAAVRWFLAVSRGA